MKVLILSCSSGGGHNACAKYIEAELNQNGIETDIQDFFKIVNKSGKDYFSMIHVAGIKINPNIFKMVYKAGEMYSKTGIISPVYLVNKLHSNTLLKYIINNKIDLVITTHVFPSLTLTAINKKGYNINFIFVSTDYECSPFNEETRPNYMVIPKGVEKRYIEKKVPKKILAPIGIPISSRFIETAKNVRKKYKLTESDRVVLITMGSLGLGKIESIINKLSNNNIKVIVVCASNVALYKKLKEENIENVIPLGYVKNMNDLLYSSDVVLTKPGGLSSTEVAVLNKSFIHIFPIPGVETYNTSFFSKRKMSYVASNEDEIINYTLKLLNSKKIQKTMIQKQKKYINQNAAKDLVKLVKTFNK